MTTTRNSAYDVRMGGGDDEVAVETDRIHRRVNVFDGGDGTDQLGIVIPRQGGAPRPAPRVGCWPGSTRNAVPAAATGFEDAEVVADHHRADRHAVATTTCAPHGCDVTRPGARVATTRCRR